MVIQNTMAVVETRHKDGRTTYSEPKPVIIGEFKQIEIETETGEKVTKTVYDYRANEEVLKEVGEVGKPLEQKRFLMEADGTLFESKDESISKQSEPIHRNINDFRYLEQKAENEKLKTQVLSLNEKLDKVLNVLASFEVEKPKGEGEE